MSDMGAASSFRQSPAGERPIVAFDFDGTLTIRDSFTAFMRDRAGAMGWATGLACISPALLAYLVDRDRGRVVGAAASWLIGRAPRRSRLLEGLGRQGRASGDRHRLA